MEAITAIVISIAIMLWVTDKDVVTTAKTKDGIELECRID